MKFLSHFSRRERIIFWVCIAVIASAVLYRLVVEKIINTWADLNLKIAKSEKQLYKNYRLIRKEKYISGEYGKYISYMKGKETGEEKASSILMEIETLARKNNVTTTDIKPSGVKSIDFYKKYIFEVTAEGDIKSLTKFIYDMQSSSKLLTVEYLSLAAKQAQSDILQAELRIIHASLPLPEL